MNTTILISISIICTLLAFVYNLYYLSKKNGNELKDTFKNVFNYKGTVLYFSFMLIVMVIVSIYLLAVYKNKILIDNIKLVLLISIIFSVALIDYKFHIIPNEVILLAIILRVLLYVIEFFIAPDSFLSIVKNDLLGCLIVVVFLCIGTFIIKNSIGMGDIKLIFIMCIYQGFYGVVSSLFMSLFASFFIAIILLIFRKKGRKDFIPFAPAVLFGTILSIVLIGI